MPNLTWLETVEIELRRHGLPRQDVARLVTELSDHWSDLVESGGATSRTFPAELPAGPLILSLTEDFMSTDANVIECLGSPERIADAAVFEFGRRQILLSRSRTAAICTFVVLPLPLLCLFWGAAVAVLMAIGELFDRGNLNPEADSLGVMPWEVLVAHGVLLAVLLIPPIGLAALYARVAGRTGSRWLWGLTACLLVAIGAALPHYTLTFGDVPGMDQGMVSVGWPPVKWPLAQACQFLLTLAIGFLVLRRSSRRDIMHRADLNCLE